MVLHPDTKVDVGYSNEWSKQVILHLRCDSLVDGAGKVYEDTQIIDASLDLKILFPLPIFLRGLALRFRVHRGYHIMLRRLKAMRKIYDRYNP